jgi:sugar phosphate isomerase/epimerase
MARTRTGSFPIGFRRGWSDWQKDAASLIAYAKRTGFEALDLGAVAPAEIQQVLDAGLSIGSIDLPQKWAELASPDASVRDAAVERTLAYVQSVLPLGVRNLFVVIFPGDANLPRAESFGHAVTGYRALCEGLKKLGPARLVIEGYPGGPPHYAALVATPETYRRFIAEMPAGTCGVNFDPSHLIRMGIDPLRFVVEFAPHVYHVHGKDTELLDDARYEFGHTQAATFTKGHGFGEWAWRYTLPGHGVAPWTRLLQTLVDAGYQGAVSVELEDENFNGSTEGEQRGLLASLQYLQHA